MYVRVLLPSLLLLAGVALAVMNVVSYRIVHPRSSPETGKPSSYLIPYQDLTFAVGDTRQSIWFIPGLKGAPLIFLCHDYGSTRSSLLNLAVLLREAGYNVCLLALRGHPGSPVSASTLGLSEGKDLAGAIQFAVKNLPVDELEVGLWGVALGAHAAVRAALQEERVRILVLDSPYPSVFDFLSQEVAQTVGFESRLMGGVVFLFAALYLWAPPAALLEDVDVAQLFPRRVLYIASLERPSFARWTRQLYAASEGPRDILVLPRSRNVLLLQSELKDYDLRILEFFRRHLPI